MALAVCNKNPRNECSKSYVGLRYWTSRPIFVVKSVPQSSEKGTFSCYFFKSFPMLHKSWKSDQNWPIQLSRRSSCLARPVNVCPVKIRSKHSSNTLLCLLRNFMGQTLHTLKDCFFFYTLDNLTFWGRIVLGFHIWTYPLLFQNLVIFTYLPNIAWLPTYFCRIYVRHFDTKI